MEMIKKQKQICPMLKTICRANGYRVNMRRITLVHIKCCILKYIHENR